MAQLEHSSPMVKVSDVITLQALTYNEVNKQTDFPNWNYVTGALTSAKWCEFGLRYPTHLRESVHPYKL